MPLPRSFQWCHPTIRAQAVWTEYRGDPASLRRAIDQYPGDFAAFSYEPTLTADPGGTMGGGSVV